MDDFEKIHRKLDAEDATHQKIIGDMKGIKDDVKRLQWDVKELTEKQAPIAEAWKDIAAAARVGRIVRNTLIFVASVIGASALIYASVKGNISK